MTKRVASYYFSMLISKRSNAIDLKSLASSLFSVNVPKLSSLSSNLLRHGLRLSKKFSKRTYPDIALKALMMAVSICISFSVFKKYKR